MSKEKKIKALQKENDALTQNILDKIAVIKELEDDYMSLTNDYLRKVNELHQARSTEVGPSEVVFTKKAPEIPFPTKVKYERWWNFSIELWPLAWGLSYYRYDWQRAKSDAREGQIQFGPFGFSWNREPKRK